MSRRSRLHYPLATIGYRASRIRARSPRPAGLPGDSLSFGAAVRYELPSHTTSRQNRHPDFGRNDDSCNCFSLMVTSDRSHKGLSPSITAPCPAHSGRSGRPSLRCPSAFDSVCRLRSCIANAQSFVFLTKFSGLITRSVSEGPSPGKMPQISPSLTRRVMKPTKFAASLSVSEAVTDAHLLADASGCGCGRRPGLRRPGSAGLNCGQAEAQVVEPVPRRVSEPDCRTAAPAAATPAPAPAHPERA